MCFEASSVLDAGARVGTPFVGIPDLAPTTFRVVALPLVDSAQAVVCGSCRDAVCGRNCQKYEALVRGLDEAGPQSAGARLHVVPLDPLVWLKRTQSKSFKLQAVDSDAHLRQETHLEVMSELVNQIKAEAAYMTFKGSDFVFVCLSCGCLEFGTEFAKMLSGTMGTRAIFATANVDDSLLKWPCPLRVIDARSDFHQSVQFVVEKILKEASFMIDRRNRWICSDTNHPENSWDGETQRTKATGIYMAEYASFENSLFDPLGSGLGLRSVHFQRVEAR